MEQINFQAIFDILQDLLPNKWSKVILYMEYGDRNYSMKYYVKSGDGEYMDCFKLEGISKAKIISGFRGIDKIISPVRETLSAGDLWSNMTITVDNTGKFRTEYDYSDLEGDTIGHFESWKREHLSEENL